MNILMRTEAATSFELRFIGPQGEIDADTLIKSLAAISKVLYEVNSSLNTGKKIDIKVRAFREGSFIVDLDIIEQFVDGMRHLFNNNNTQVATEVVALAGILFMLVKKYRGRTFLIEKGKQIDGDTFELNIDGQVSRHPVDPVGLFDNPEIIIGIKQLVQATVDDNEIEAITLIDPMSESLKDSQIFGATREELSDMKEGLQEEVVSDEVQKSRDVTVRASMAVVRPSFDPKTSWSFLHNGQKTTAQVEDSLFMQRIIDRQERFGAGDSLEVDLTISQQWNEQAADYENTRFKVVKVYHHNVYQEPKAVQDGTQTTFDLPVKQDVSNHNA